MFAKRVAMEAGIFCSDCDSLEHLTNVSDHTHFVLSEAKCNIKDVYIDIVTLGKVVIQRVYLVSSLAIVDNTYWSSNGIFHHCNMMQEPHILALTGVCFKSAQDEQLHG